jgi:antitoxin component HigA of HigAB toxin-antitoxin module
MPTVLAVNHSLRQHYHGRMQCCANGIGNESHAVLTLSVQDVVLSQSIGSESHVAPILSGQDAALCQKYWQRFTCFTNTIRAGCGAVTTVLAADHTLCQHYQWRMRCCAHSIGSRSHVAPTLSGQDVGLAMNHMLC